MSFIGAGNYASSSLIPAFANCGADFHGLSASSGDKITSLAKKYKFRVITTDSEKLIKENDSNTIIIATRHDSHSKLVSLALKEEKNVFVEKPICLNLEQLNLIKKTYIESQEKSSRGKYKSPILMVGFNRRFSPLVQQLKAFLREITDFKSFVYTINSGFINPDHWIQNPEIGGGRFLGEACHFVRFNKIFS